MKNVIVMKPNNSNILHCHVCISFIRTLGTHNNQIIVTSRNTHALDQCGYLINSEIA